MESKQQVRIGDIVKSLDFVGINDCYYVGVVVGINKVDGTFTARTLKRVREGMPLESDAHEGYVDAHGAAHFTAPLPGQHMFDDEWIEPRVQVIA